ncbi:MAG: tetratricopeptide repeat protein [Magnetococcus sp. YQC-5]
MTADTAPPSHDGYAMAVQCYFAGRYEQAQLLLDAYLITHAHAPEAWNLRASLARIAHDPIQAESAYQEALRIDPNGVDTWYNLGNFFKEQHRLTEAEAAYRQALRLQPNDAQVHNNLGMLLAEQHRYSEAELAYREALRLQPHYAKAGNNLGVCLTHQHQYEAAEQIFRQALTLDPDHVELHNNLGALLKQSRRFAAAETAYRQALHLHPGHAKALNNLGNLLTEQKRFTAAETAFQRALRIHPDCADTHYNLGILLTEQKRFVEAQSAHRRALEIQPDHAGALAEACNCAKTLCQWHHIPNDALTIRTALEQGMSFSPFSLLSLPFDDGVLLRQAGAMYGTNQLGPILTTPPLVDPWSHPPRDRLRIGYLSADFHNHATAHLLVGILETHDRHRFAIHCYSYGPELQDNYRQRIVQSSEIFRNLVNHAERDIAQQIADDGIDILIDLKGYTKLGRPEITAQRPAPILVNWLGYPGSLGHPRLADYLIGDPLVTPPEQANHFSETLALLPHCYQPNDRHRIVAATPSRRSVGLPEEGLIFCCFNQSYKFGPESFSIWCRLLQEVPGSLLWLQEPPPMVVTTLRSHAAQHGIDPDRLVFAPVRPLAEHLGRLTLADLALDTFPVTSHTTASDALWSGVPLITKMGNTFVSRVAASLLHAMGVPELVTHTWEAYFEQALDLALHPDRLRHLHDRLSANRLTHPLFDTERFARDLERLYERMWLDHGQGKRDMILLPPS